MRVLLIAEEAAGIQMLRALSGLDHEVVAVVADEMRTASASATVSSVAAAMGYARWDASGLASADMAASIRDARVDIALNVHSLRVIHPEILEAPRIGCFNLHPGPLPRYAGLNAASWAIYRQEASHGVTVHRMDRGIDTGPLAYQETFPIDEHETGLSLSARCVAVGVPLMLRLLRAATDDPEGIPSQPQDLGAREYFGRQVPDDGILDWGQPAARVAALIRAADFFPLRSPWGHPVTWLDGQEIGIVSGTRSDRVMPGRPGTMVSAEPPTVDVACCDGWVNVARVHFQGQYRSASACLAPGGHLGANVRTVGTSRVIVVDAQG